MYPSGKAVYREFCSLKSSTKVETQRRVLITLRYRSHRLMLLYRLFPIFPFCDVDTFQVKECRQLIMNRRNKFLYFSVFLRLQCTCEMENNNWLNFLDITIIRENDKLITNWYKTPTFSGRYINYYSSHPY